MQHLMEEGIDAYVADNKFRQRDPRFTEAGRYKEKFKQELAKRLGRKSIYQPKDFTFSPDMGFCICPAGKRLYRNGGNVLINGKRFIKFMGSKTNCIPCGLRAQCMKNPAQTVTRQVAYATGKTEYDTETFSQKMRRKIDSITGRLIYSRRMATVEPVFANVRSNLDLDSFSLRGKRKVNIQWLLYCTVHNLFKIYRYGPGFA
jgi:hypothetical protein